MRKPGLLYYLFAAVLFSVSCKTFYQPSSVKFIDYRISAKQPASNDITALLQPYSDSVNRNMNDVIAVAGMVLEKKQPEGTLGNLLADAQLIMAREKYNTKVDASFVNFGGIRLPSIPAGNITRGKIYELSPFDNVIVLLKANGRVMQQFLDVVAGRGGWPSAGITYQIKNKKAINIVIGGTPMKEDGEYVIALVDYIANGGDNCDMLKPLPQQNNGYLFRDAILQYLARQQQQGRQITAKIENRVTNAD